MPTLPNPGICTSGKLGVVRAEPHAASGLVSTVAYAYVRQTEGMVDMEIRRTIQGPFTNSPTQVAVS
jgi:hypothetical protein